MCTKIKHRSMLEAIQHIKRLRKTGEAKKSGKMGIYYHNECRGFHITRKISKDNIANI